MPVLRGENVRVEIGDGMTPTEGFDPIGGEVEVQWGDSSREFDTASKDDGDFDLVEFSGRTIRFNMSGKVKLPDPGYERLIDVRNSPTKNATLRIVKGTTVAYQGECGWGSNDTNHANRQASTWSSVAAPSKVPTINDLAAFAS
ncbi:hypothetical protein SAMN06295912_108118 [Sphingomonas laterariae]|uniref:Phage tail tube protein n=1 Tax=Edaphosphingomonas laterariae TaxID=861865 RepID=A0A239F837_9SPHN|nr:hypothetical protein [Sphingomonas laterariae]SNS53200.1 hypothetical protein SAMN06295912_108118 [Sphingomonas laterariae]